MTDDQPEPVAVLFADSLRATLYDDGEVVRAGEGDAHCSEHGDIVYDSVNKERCDHGDPGDRDRAVPHFDISDFADIAIDDPAVRDAALEDQQLFERFAEIIEG